MHERVSGWKLKPVDPSTRPKRAGVGDRDRREFPGVYAFGHWLSGSGWPIRPGFATPGAPVPLTRERVCTGPVKYIVQDVIKSDVATLRTALAGKSADGFIAALGPLASAPPRAMSTTRAKRPS